LKEVFVFIDGLFCFLSTSSKLPDIDRDREEYQHHFIPLGTRLGMKDKPAAWSGDMDRQRRI